MQTQPVSAYLGAQISTEHGRQLDDMQNRLLALVAEVNGICDQVSPMVAASILYYFSTTAFSFVRYANERSAKSVANMILPPLTDDAPPN